MKHTQGEKNKLSHREWINVTPKLAAVIARGNMFSTGQRFGHSPVAAGTVQYSSCLLSPVQLLCLDARREALQSYTGRENSTPLFPSHIFRSVVN